MKHLNLPNLEENEIQNDHQVIYHLIPHEVYYSRYFNNDTLSVYIF